ALRAAVKARPAPRVLYVLWPDPLLVPGRDSHLTEMIELAGGRSITGGEPVSYVRFSIEAAVARAPEVIVLADHSTGASTAGRAAPEKWQALTSVPAIRAGRLYSVDLSVLHRYGPRVPEGLELVERGGLRRGARADPRLVVRDRGRARRGRVRLRGGAARGDDRLPGRDRARRPRGPDPAPDRRHRRHLLFGRDHRDHLGRRLQPPDRRDPLAARQPRADPRRFACAVRRPRRRRRLADYKKCR